RESTIWDCRYNAGEIEAITAAVVEELSGQTPNIRRPLRAGDQSFLGVGLSSLGAFRMLPVDHPDRKAVGGCGGGCGWHWPEDTLDKADATILAEDTRIYVALTARMCLPEVIPFDFTPAAQDFLDHLAPLQEIAGGHLDLGDVIAAAERFKAAARALAETPCPDAAGPHRRLKRVGGILNSAAFPLARP